MKESGLQCDEMIDSDLIDHRVNIKKLICQGEIE